MPSEFMVDHEAIKRLAERAANADGRDELQPRPDYWLDRYDGLLGLIGARGAVDRVSLKARATVKEFTRIYNRLHRECVVRNPWFGAVG